MTPLTASHQAPLSFTISWSLLRFTSIECNAIEPSLPLPSPYPFAFGLSSIRIFSNESALRIRWPKYWSFSFSISPSNEYSGLIFFLGLTKNSLFLSCSCNLQHSLEFTEHSVPSRDDSTPGEPVHSLGFQSSGINRDNCVRRKPTRPVGQGVWWVGMWVCPGAGCRALE